jgi:hypothetical protein
MCRGSFGLLRSWRSSRDEAVGQNLTRNVFAQPNSRVAIEPSGRPYAQFASREGRETARSGQPWATRGRRKLPQLRPSTRERFLFAHRGKRGGPTAQTAVPGATAFVGGLDNVVFRRLRLRRPQLCARWGGPLRRPSFGRGRQPKVALPGLPPANSLRSAGRERNPSEGFAKARRADRREAFA